MKVVFTADARRAVDAADAWWREHRDHTDLFERELTAAVEQIAEMPDVLAVYAATRRGLVRRLLLPKTNHHIYFVADTDARIVLVVAVWGAVKRSGPPLK